MADPVEQTPVWRARAGYAVCAVVGLVFIASAALKAMDVQSFAVQVSYYRIVTEPWAVRMVAWGSIVVEALAGMGLVAAGRVRAPAAVLSAVLLVGFSLIMAYAWLVHDLEDCGCFGKYLRLSPGPSIVKNIALLALLGGGMRLGRGRRVTEARRWRWTVATAGGLLVAATMALGARDTGPGPATRTDGAAADAEAPFAAYHGATEKGPFDLASGTWLVAMLSVDCEHCQAAVTPLNMMAFEPEAPPVVGLMMGDADGLEAFRVLTEPLFPTTRIDPLEFMALTGDAPPRFYLVRDGAALAHWDEAPPDMKAIREVLATAGETAQAA